jgi:hypothetical protein
VSSSDQGKKPQSLAEYEKDYIERLQKLKDGQNLQNLIYDLSKDFKKPVVTSVDYVGHCTFCMMGVPREEMIYKNSHLFHSNCFEQQGKNFPAQNQEFLMQNSNDKVQLVQLRNLKIRMMGNSNPKNSKPKSKTKKKSKRKAKKRPAKRRVVKRKRTSTKRKKTKKKTSGRKISKKRRVVKRRTSPKRKKTTRKTKRRASRTKRKSRRRR